MKRILFLSFAVAALFCGCQPKSEENLAKEPMSGLDSLQALNPTGSELSRFIAEVEDRILYDSISRMEGDTTFKSIGTEVGDTNISVLCEDAGAGTERVTFRLSHRTSTGVIHLQTIDLKANTVKLKLNASNTRIEASSLNPDNMGGSLFTKIVKPINKTFDVKVLRDFYGQTAIIGVNDARDAPSVKQGSGFVATLNNPTYSYAEEVRLWYDDANNQLRISGKYANLASTNIFFCNLGVTVNWGVDFDDPHICP